MKGLLLTMVQQSKEGSVLKVLVNNEQILKLEEEIRSLNASLEKTSSESKEARK